MFMYLFTCFYVYAWWFIYFLQTFNALAQNRAFVRNEKLKIEKRCFFDRKVYWKMIFLTRSLNLFFMETARNYVLNLDI